MDFELTEEVKATQQEARRFAQTEILPTVSEEAFKRDLVTKMGQLGFFGCAFPAHYGGSDLGFLAHSVVCEEISRADSGLRLSRDTNFSEVRGHEVLRFFPTG